ncbi:MAG: hypothetical protein HUJ26_13515 [Planctomycetaceae bacterium]|nr:hypothetical protein [Planctomycetaceae bacterium]
MGGFGITETDDLLLVTDFQLVNQVCSWAHVAFEDESVADFFDHQVDEGRTPEEFGRIWIHTHPGDSPWPSNVDEETFERVFGRADWAVMFILARGGDCYARLRYNHGPKAEFEIPVGVDYSLPFAGSDHESWEREYRQHVLPEEDLRFTLSPLAEELVSAEDLELVDDWPAGWFDEPDNNLLTEEDFYETDE